MPNRVKWEVAIAKRSCGWYFHEGWSEFVYKNHVSNGEWLTFIHAGDGLFYVKRFTFTSGCPPRADLEIGGLHIVPNDDQLDVESSDGWLDSPSEIESLTGTGLDTELTESNTEPSFTVAMLGSATEQHPNIPTEFWNANIAMDGHKIKACLTVHHRTWDVLIAKKSSGYVVHGGWKTFVSDNDLGTGSRCTFNLVPSDGIHFHVVVNW